MAAEERAPALPGKRKAAILLLCLGSELSAKVLRHLREEEVEQLTLELAGARRIPEETRRAVLEEFHRLCLARDFIVEGGVEYAREVLERALGPQGAAEVIGRLTAALHVRPFAFLRRADSTHLAGFLQGEHPQTAALIMAYLAPEQAAVVLSSLPPERQADVARRIALMDKVSPDMLQEVERVLERKLSSLVTQDYARAGGIESAVEVLKRVDRGSEKTILETLEVEDPELAREIKKRMFVFEDLILLDDRSVQRVLRRVDLSRDLPLALKATSEEVKAKIFRNISKRAAETLKENIGYLGPVRLRDVEEAQQKIVGVIRRLEMAGEVIVARGGKDDVVV